MKTPQRAVEEPHSQPLPGGRHGLSRAHVSTSQRTRLLRAVTEAVGDKGYAATTIADITERADVSKKTFYVYFDSKDACFLAAYEAFAAWLLKEMDEAGRTAAAGWRQRYTRSVEKYLALLAARPARTRALMIEPLAAGPAVLRRRRAILKSYADQLRDLHAQARSEDASIAEVPPRLFLIAVGGVDELVRDHISHGRMETLATLAPQILENFSWLMRAAVR